MKRYENSPEKRREKIVAKQNLESRKRHKDKRFHLVDENEVDEFDMIVKIPKGKYEQAT